MNVIICPLSLSVFMMLSTAVLVIVNGQPTTDVNIDNDEIAQLRAELVDLKRQFTELSAKKSDQSKYSPALRIRP